MATEKKAVMPILEVLGVRVIGQPHISAKSGSIGFRFNQPSIVGPDGVVYTFQANLTAVGTSADYCERHGDEVGVKAATERAAAALAAQDARAAAKAKRAI